MAGVQIDGVNNKIDFDDDLDTSISANTDDTLVFEIAGATDFTMTANTFTAASGSTIAAQALTATTVVGSGAAQFATAGIGAAKDLGVGLHIKSADSGASAHASADELVIEGSANSGINILSGNSSEGGIYFGDDGDNDIGRIRYDHANNSLDFFTNAAERMSLASNGGVIITTGDNLDTLKLVSTDADATSGPILNFYRNSASPADGDILGKLNFTGNDAGGSTHSYGTIEMECNGVVNGQEQGKFIFKVSMPDGALANVLRLDRTQTVFNEDSEDIDFRVEGNGDTHLIFADAANDDVYIGYYTGGDNSDAMLYVAVDVNEEVAKFTANLSTYGEDVIHLDCTRAGVTNYNLIRATSNGNNDSELILAGNGALNIDGTLTENGADYAEYFEWNDGNSSDEDRVGLSVKLNGNKIVASSGSDDAADIIGVISGNPAVVGDASWNKWNDKHEKDDYGRYVWEDYTVTEWTELADTLGGGEQTLQLKSYQTDKIPDGVTAPDADVTVDGVLTKTAKVIISKGAGGENLSRRKENSSWDATATYVPRAERKEWDAVGLVGKLRMKKGQKTGTNWIKMRNISDTVEEWLVR